MLADQVAAMICGAVGAVVGTALLQRRRRRLLDRADASGGVLEFPGAVLGSAGYCHPAGGMLRLDGTTLTWLTGKGGMSFPVPTDRLTVRALADVRMSEAFPGDRNVAVVCDDAGTPVRIVVLAPDLHYRARALPGLAALLPTPGEDGTTRRR